MEQNLDPFRAIGTARASLVVSLVTAGAPHQTHRHGRPTRLAPGLDIAPGTFGQFANQLLVGNFGDGTINVFDPNLTNGLLGTLTDSSGNPTGLMWFRRRRRSPSMQI